MTSKSFKLTLNIAQSALSVLKEKQLALLAFRGYQGTFGIPSIWYTNKKPMEKISLEWNDEHKGFISDTPLLAGNQILVKKGFDMKSGQSADLDYEGQGNMTFFEPLDSDDKSTYYMMNSSIVNVKAVGLMTKNPDGLQTPCCACSFLSNSLIEMKPVPSSIFLTFASIKHNEGELMEKSPSDGVLVQLASDNATLSHDGHQWEVSGATVTKHGANSDMRKILAGK
jgi:hypothetical protein